MITGRLTRSRISRTNDYKQAGERYRTMPDWERDDLVLNMVTLMGECEKHIQERMIAHFFKCDQDYGRRVAQGLNIEVSESMLETV